MKFYLYIIKDEDDNIYVGQTNNLGKRVQEHGHKHKKSSKYVKDNGNFKLIYQEEYNSRLGVMRREKQIKGWTRAKKEALINKDIALLKRL